MPTLRRALADFVPAWYENKGSQCVCFLGKFGLMAAHVDVHVAQIWAQLGDS